MNYGLNYMGSKNTIAEELVQYMLNRHPDRDIFVDATAGGMAMAHYILRETKNVKVIANDLNPYFIDLYRMMVTNPDVVRDFAYTWMSREDIMRMLKDPDSEPKKWKVAMAITIWSFGGKGESYLYSVDIMDEKHSVFDAVMNNIWANNLLAFKETIPPKLLTNDGIDFTNKRLEIVRLYGVFKGEQYHLENLNRAERLMIMCNDFYANRDRLSLYNKDYAVLIDGINDVTIPRCIVYLDPPYENTATYMIQNIDYLNFWKFTKKHQATMPVYVSSYAAPSDITKVWEKGKVVGIGGAKNRKITLERLYYNNYNVVSNSLFDLIN